MMKCFENITIEDIINYTDYVAGMKEATGYTIREPYFKEEADLKENADTIDRWTVILSNLCKKTGSKDAKRILLLIENSAKLTEFDFALLDSLISDEVKLAAVSA